MTLDNLLNGLARTLLRGSFGLVLGYSGMACETASGNSPSQTACASDSECKGDRVCVGGECRDSVKEERYMDVDNNQNITPQSSACQSHITKGCHQNNLYWKDSCGNIEEKIEECYSKCKDDHCCGNDYRCFDGDVYMFEAGLLCETSLEQDCDDQYEFCEDAACKAKLERWADLGNGTVQDDKTGLIWQKVSEKNLKNDAQGWPYCENLSIANLTWRLPIKNELKDLWIEQKIKGCHFSLIFEGGCDYIYWAEESEHSATIDFGNNNPDAWSTQKGGYVRCVSD